MTDLTCDVPTTFSDVVTFEKGLNVVGGSGLYSDVPYSGANTRMPQGPYKVDRFDAAVDNHQLVSTVKYLVSDYLENFENPLPADRYTTIVEDGEVYFGREEEGGNVFLTYPISANYTFTVPSTRTEGDTFPLFSEHDTANNEVHLSGSDIDDFMFTQGAIGDTMNGNLGYIDPDDPDGYFMSIISNVDQTGNIFNPSDTFWSNLYDLSTYTEQEDQALPAAQYYVVTGIKNAQAGLPYFSFLPGLIFSFYLSLRWGPPDIRIKLYDIWNNSKNRSNMLSLQSFSKKYSANSVMNTESNVYDTHYDFSEIKLPDPEKKLPLVFFGEPMKLIGNLPSMESYASWGFACCSVESLYITDHTHRRPDAPITVAEIISQEGTLANIFSRTTGFANDRRTPASFGWPTLIDTVDLRAPGDAVVYTGETSETGKTSLDMSASHMESVLVDMEKIKDSHGNNLSNKIDLNNLGIYALSASVNFWGANELNRASDSPKFKSAVLFDATYVLGETLELTYTPDKLRDLGLGFQMPVMVMEPEVSQYSEGDMAYSERPGVGRRRSLQDIIRNTNSGVRANTVFVEHPTLNHFNSDTSYGPAAIATYAAGDKAFDFHDSSKQELIDPLNPLFSLSLEASDYKARLSQIDLNMNIAYLRSQLLKTIPLNIVSNFPFKSDIAPWAIPNSDDYQFPQKDNIWSLDMGGRFLMTVSEEDGKSKLKISARPA